MGDYPSMKSNSFKITPGFTFGYSTGIILDHDTNMAAILGIDVGYTRIMGYEYQVSVSPWNGYNKYRDEYDTQHQYSSVEIGLGPTVSLPICRNFQLSLYCGYYAGVGTKTNESNRLSHTIVATRTDFVYSEPDSYSNYSATSALGAGISVYYKRLMIDVRYKSTYVIQEARYHNLYLQLGFVL